MISVRRLRRICSVAHGNGNGYCDAMGRAAGAERGVKRGLLLMDGGGLGKDVRALVAQGMDLIVAADSGFEPALAAGPSPDLVAGGKDTFSNVSLPDRFPPRHLLTFPRDDRDL
jgi:hypothetical protein